MKLGDRVPGVAALLLLAAACSVGAGEGALMGLL